MPSSSTSTFVDVEHDEKRRPSTNSFKDYQKAFLETSKLQFRSLGFYQALIAEFVGVFILVLVVCGLNVKLDENAIVPGLVGILGGPFTLATMIWFSSSISGGHLNPAITIALVFTNECNILKGVFYIIFQLLGGVLGALTMNTLLPIEEYRSEIGLTLVNKNVSMLNAFGVEFIITFVLALTVFACVDVKKNRKDLGGSYPLSVSLSVIIGAVFGGAYTGASMNPARSFGPAVVQNVWTSHWVYWLGPIIGSLCAGICYKLIFKKKSHSD